MVGGVRFELTYTGSKDLIINNTICCIRLLFEMAVCTGFEPVISAVTGQHPRPLNEQTTIKAHNSFDLPTDLSAKLMACGAGLEPAT